MGIDRPRPSPVFFTTLLAYLLAAAPLVPNSVLATKLTLLLTIVYTDYTYTMQLTVPRCHDTSK